MGFFSSAVLIGPPKEGTHFAWSVSVSGESGVGFANPKRQRAQAFRKRFFHYGTDALRAVQRA